jgi:hypothetical protein
MNNLIVARFRDGSVRKGTSLDVSHKKPVCHLKTSDAGTIQIKLEELKALFFVKDLSGNPAHQEARDPEPGDPRLVGGKRVSILFEDGETIIGTTNSYPPVGPFFFLVPIDPKSNNARILVNRKAIRTIKEIAGA